MQYKLDLWSKDGFDLKQLLLPQLPLDRHLNANLICHISLCVPYNYMCLATLQNTCLWLIIEALSRPTLYGVLLLLLQEVMNLLYHILFKA